MEKFTLLTVLEIKHISKNGELLWESYNLPNVLHQEGEDFLLRAAFVGGKNSIYIPDDYYFGLDNRSSISESDTMNTIVNEGSEPNAYGYFRQAVGSLEQFNIHLLTSGHYAALSPIISFVASGGSWGPIKNLFLTDKSNNEGYLISSVSLDKSITVLSGEGIHMRMGLTVGYCPDMPDI